MSRMLKFQVIFWLVSGLLLMTVPSLVIFPFGLFLFAIGLCAAVSIPGAAIGLVRGGDIPTWAASGLRSCGWLLVCAVFVCTPSVLWTKSTEFGARRYVARAVKVLNEEKKRAGRYPATLQKVGLDGNDAFESARGRFSTNGESFRFSYTAPLGPFDVWEFTSERQEWEFHPD